MTVMRSQDSVAAVILAAGRGARFGAPKPMTRVGSRTMLGVVADTAMAAGCAPVIAVVPPGVLVPEGVEPVTNAAPAAGMSRSLQLGLGALPDDAAAALVLLADQPTVGVTHLQRLIGARGTVPVVATHAGGHLGPPVILERDAFRLTSGLTGDVGLRHLLRASPDRVTSVDVSQPLPDVDTPADLERITEPCPGCRARYLRHEVDELHPYVGASPACWAAYGELLAREFRDVAYGRVHRQSADVYAVQHPGSDDLRQRRSVALHLVALCHWVEHDLAVDRLGAVTPRPADADRRWPWLAPFPTYDMTVLDVLEARSAADHVTLVRRWAEVTWRAWSEHHDLVRAWARDALDGG